MKKLSFYLIENGEESSTRTIFNSIKNAIKKELGKDSNTYCIQRSSRHANDLFKGPFGGEKNFLDIFANILKKENDNTYVFTQNIINNINTGLNREKVEKIKYIGYRVFGASAGTSSQYMSFKLEVTCENKMTYNVYIMDTSSSVKASMKKAFTPNKLLDLTIENNEDNEDNKNIKLFKSFKELEDMLTNNIDNANFDEDTKDTLKNLIKFIKDGKIKGNFNGNFGTFCSNPDKLELYIEKPNSIQGEVFTGSAKDIKEIIGNDFGEILDALLFVKLFKNEVPVGFPLSARQQAVDLYIGSDANKIGISAKNKGGAAASGSQLVYFYQNSPKNDVNSEKLDKQTNKVAQEIEDNPDELPNNNGGNIIKEITNNIWNKPTDYGLCWLVDKYVTNNKDNKLQKDIELQTAIKNIFNVDYFKSINGGKGIKQAVVNKVGSIINGDGKEYENLYNLYKLCWTRREYRVAGKSDRFINLFKDADFRKDRTDNAHEDNVDKFISNIKQYINTDIIFGAMIYPLYSSVVRTDLNNNHEITKALTAECQRVLTYRQCYLNITENKLTFTIKLAEKSNWKFQVNGSCKQPTIKKLSIVLA